MGKKSLIPPSKYDSIIASEYERYKEDCGLKIGDHKILCKVFDAQDKNLKQMLSDGYDVQAKVITDIVREMNVLQRAEIADMLRIFKKEIFEEIGKVKKAVEDISREVQKQKEDLGCVELTAAELKKDVMALSSKNTDQEINKRIWKGVWIGVAIMTVIYVPVTIIIIWYLYKTYWSLIN